jgi:hypothetical protein
LAFLRPVVRLTRVLPTLWGVSKEFFFFRPVAGAVRDWRLNVLSDGEGGRGLEVVPVLLGEAIGAVVSVKGSLCGMRAVVLCVLMGGCRCRMVQRIVLTHGSVRFFKPFLPFDNLLFLPTAMFASLYGN